MIKDRGLIFEKQLGVSDFPLRIAYTDSTQIKNSDRVVYLHWHKEFELSYIIEGSMVMEIDAKPMLVQAGDVIMINPNEIHSSYCINDTNCRLYGIIFSMDLLSSSRKDVCQTKYVEPFLSGLYKLPALIQNEPGWQLSVVENVRMIIQAYQVKTMGYELRIKAGLYTILSEIISNQVFLTTPPAAAMDQNHLDIERLQKSIQYMETHYTKRIYIEEIAAESGLGVERFYKFFKRYTGETPVSYLNRHRIRIAINYLLYTDQSVLDIAYKTGFENVSYFIKTFKKHTGVTPGEIRKQGLKDGLV
ncbi:AraC family transcriptional regulator [Paenibacillus wynnii]|uniref:HTH araC/xylS-type domain-containing protein n=1 Tax=Paenibacillus wynnii TaxID=268407 RepID=A0A098M8B0_9BACL|nr:AraC family transcriptional regulator [Paenibacillus wynnii]KGE18780.1 hypothetical protein PWYN_04910 [Paenibacillus wynnii]